MGTQKIEIGDICEVPTAIGNAYIQYMAEVDQTTLIRLLCSVGNSFTKKIHSQSRLFRSQKVQSP